MKAARRWLPSFGDLVRAVRRESSYGICRWFGVHDSTVWKWRKALGVPERNFGTRKIWEANAAAGSFWSGIRAAQANASDPVRRAGHAAARRGKRHLRSRAARRLDANAALQPVTKWLMHGSGAGRANASRLVDHASRGQMP